MRVARGRKGASTTLAGALAPALTVALTVAMAIRTVPADPAAPADAVAPAHPATPAHLIAPADPSPAADRAAPAAPVAADLDARHVRTEVPSRLVADEVFEARITMRNTGAKAWGDGLRLRSEDPPGNETWGTSTIYLGQGRTLEPGGEITFVSFLRAPSAPGRHVFRWRAARSEDGAPFGEATPALTIVVDPRPPEARTHPQEPPVRGPSAKRVLASGDLEYAGSFKVPDEVDGCGSGFTESGLALRRAKDGSRSLFLRTGLRRTIVYEAAIPALVKLEGADPSGLKVAAVKKVWGELRLPDVDGEPFLSNAGLLWDEATSTLYWSYYHGYLTSRRPVLGASLLVEGREATHLGPWRIPDSVPGFKCYWGGVTRLPRGFADRHTGGRTLALGFGGYYSICAAASRGPALAAVAEPDPAKGELDVIELLAYPWPMDVAAPRDGDYFVANSPWGGRQPESRERGWWTMDDAVRAGVFIDLPEAHAFLALAYLGTGRIGYDYGTIRSAGDACAWYFYDPDDLGEVADGRRKPWEVSPRSVARVRYPRGIREGSEWGSAIGDVTGACFDEEARLLYVYQRFCIDAGTRELYPCIHAYRVR